MMRPYDFSFNVQTAQDNEFQHYPKDEATTEINVKAMSEFAHAVNILEHAGVEVIVLDKPDYAPTLPDAVFPNNWLMTTPDNCILTFPMAAPNRRDEIRQLPLVEEALVQKGYNINAITHFGRYQENEKFLEGTGSMVIDHVNLIVYAAVSERTNLEQLEYFVQKQGFQKAVHFETKSSHGKPFYHTNVMMAIGDHFAIVCLASIPNEEERQKVKISLEETGHEIIEISLSQAEQSMCGNALQLCDQEGKSLIAMSQTAYEGFSEEQKNTLGKYGKLLPIAIPTIERIGGGSIRCMLAEVFLQKQP